MRVAPLAVALVALALRVSHVLFTAKFSVADDAVFFERHAMAFIEVWQALGTAQFGTLLRDAVDHASLQGIAYPVVLSVVYAAAGGVNHVAAGLLQAVLSAATVWLTYLTARRAFGGVAGFAAGIVAAIYPPLILTAGLLLAEAALGFIQALAAYALLRGLAPHANGSRILAGVAIGTLMLRPAFQYTGVLVFLGLGGAYLLMRARGGGADGFRRLVADAARFMAPYVAGLLFIAVPWIAANGLVYGSTAWSRTGDAWQQVYWGIYPPNRGWWPPDSPVPPKYGVESLPGARSGGRVIEVRDLDYLEAAIDQVRATPFQAAATQVNKLYQGFMHPFNTYGERAAGLAPFAVPVHRALIVLGLTGLALSWRRPASSLVLAALTLAISLPFLVSHIDVRYVIPIALLATLFAGHAIDVVVQFVRVTEPGALVRPMAAIAGTFAVWLASVPIILVMAPGMEPLLVHRLHTAAVCLAFVAAPFAVFRLCSRKAPEHTRRWNLSAGAVGGTLALLFTVQAFYAGDWHEWTADLKPGDKIIQSIALPPSWMPPPGGRAEVRLYAQGSHDHAYAPVLRAGDRVIARLGPAFTEGGPLRFEETIMVAASRQGKPRAGVPQWYGVPLDFDLLRGDTLRLELTPEPLPGQDASASWIRVWGDYTPAPGRRLYEGPSVHSRITGTDDSFQKFVATGHPRLWRRLSLASPATTAARATAGRELSNDLSASPGRQTGEYRLRVLIFGPSGDLAAAF